MSNFKGVFSGLLLVIITFSVAVTSVSAGKDHDDHRQHDQVRPPEKVEKLKARQQGDAIKLRWHAVHGPCDGYRIYHEAGDELLPGSFWYDVNGSQTTSLFSDVTAGGHYTFRVSATDGKLEGPLSRPVTVIMKDKIPAGPSDTAN